LLCSGVQLRRVPDTGDPAPAAQQAAPIRLIPKITAENRDEVGMN
jgi:hypothetical protein